MMADASLLEATRLAREEAARREAARLAEIDRVEREARSLRLAQAARERTEREARERRLAEQRAAEQTRQRELAERAAREDAVRAERERQLALARARGDAVVQVGAFRSADQAQDALRSADRFFPSFARGEVVTARTDSGTWFRARFFGLAAEAASEACRLVERGGGACEIISR
jgi:D-alanyl-D-alanine carboxypeptidase